MGARFLSAAVAVTLLPAVASADDDIHVGVFAGAHLYSQKLELGTDDSEAADSPQNSVAFGVRAAYELSDRWSAEGELMISPTRARNANADVVVFGWRAHAIYHFLSSDSALRPIATAGVGALTVSSTHPQILAEDTDALFHGGLGLRYALSDRWDVRADARALFPPSSAGRFVTTDYEFFVGLTQSFPQSPPPAQSPAAQ